MIKLKSISVYTFATKECAVKNDAQNGIRKNNRRSLQRSDSGFGFLSCAEAFRVYAAAGAEGMFRNKITAEC